MAEAEFRVAISGDLWAKALRCHADIDPWFLYDEWGISRPRPPRPRDTSIVTFKDWLDSRPGRVVYYDPREGTPTYK